MSRTSLAVRTRDAARKGAASLAAVPLPAAVSLGPVFGFSLPRLTGVPVSASFTTTTAELVAISRCLAYGGVLKPEHFGKRTLQSAVEHSLHELVAPHESRWRLYKRKLSLGYTGDVGDDGFPARAHKGRGLEDEHVRRAAVTFACTDWSRNCFLIGRKLSDLNRRNPGVGAKIVALMEAGLGLGVGAISPRTAIEIVECHCWYGETNPDEALMQARDSWDPNETPTDEEVAKECNIPLQKDIDRWFPEKWVYDASLVTWDKHNRDKRKIRVPGIGPIDDPYGKEIRSTAQKLGRLILKAEAEHDACLNQHHEMENTCEFAKPVILRWSDEDRIPALYDDVMQQVVQSGEEAIDLAGAVLFDPDSPEQCAVAGDRLRLMLEAISLVDELISFFISNEPLIHVFGDELRTDGTGHLLNHIGAQT